MKRKPMSNPNSMPFFDQPSDCFELINKYGTHNIQPTADTANPFPAIAQGLPRALCRKANEDAEKTREAYSQVSQTSGQ